MKYENKITVSTDHSFDELMKQIINKNFKYVKEYEVNDIYLVKKIQIIH